MSNYDGDGGEYDGHEFERFNQGFEIDFSRTAKYNNPTELCLARDALIKATFIQRYSIQCFTPELMNNYVADSTPRFSSECFLLHIEGEIDWIESVFEMVEGTFGKRRLKVWQDFCKGYSTREVAIKNGYSVNSPSTMTRFRKQIDEFVMNIIHKSGRFRPV